MARITRKELKSDKFALEVEHTVTFFEEHQPEIIRYGGIGLAVILVIVAVVLYQRSAHAAREVALAEAIRVQEAPAGGVAAMGGLSFPTQEAKDQAAIKAFTDVQTKYSGSSEAAIAGYYLGSIKADHGKLVEAEKTFQNVAQDGGDYASLAKLALAQIYFSDGRDSQGESTLRDLIAHPTIFVSSDQATMLLARYLGPKKPAEARKLLEPLRTHPGAVGQAALTLSSELPAQ